MLKKHCDTYRICKKVVEQGNQLSDRERVLFQKKHSLEYQLHEQEKKELGSFGVIKLPSPEKIVKNIDQLHEKKSLEKETLQVHMKQQKELLVIQLISEECCKYQSHQIKKLRLSQIVSHSHYPI